MYPKSFFEPIINKTISSIISRQNQDEIESGDELKDDAEEKPEKMIFLQFRGRVSESFEMALKKLQTPCKVIFTLKKLKTVLPSLKPKVDVSLRSRVVYKIICPCCTACYVGQTIRHLLCRIREHRRLSTCKGAYFRACNVHLTMSDMSIIASSLRTVSQLMTLEALCINDLKPSLDTKVSIVPVL